VLVMGVTPELCGLPLNPNSRVIAVDKTMDMIRAIWPSRTRRHDEVVCADWRQIPLANSSVNLILGDGCLNILPYPSGFLILCAEFRRLLRPNGAWLVRCFVQSEPRETVQHVLTELSEGRIGSFHVLKWRLVMAAQPDPESGVTLSEVWTLLNDVWRDYKILAECFRWPVEEVRTIEAYRETHAKYCFLTFDQHCEVFHRAGFSVVKTMVPSYELGERCPTFVLSPLEQEASRS
jgi:hypothetical protein